MNLPSSESELVKLTEDPGYYWFGYYDKHQMKLKDFSSKHFPGIRFVQNILVKPYFDLGSQHSFDP